MNTRTVYSNPLTRLLFCPHQVNYHLEHHLLASAPIYRLRKIHQVLLSRGVYRGVSFPAGYLKMLRQVTVPVPDPVAA